MVFRTVMLFRFVTLSTLVALAACNDTREPTTIDTRSLATDSSNTPADTESTTDDNLDFLIRFGIREAPAKAPGAIRLATYNAENLFDEIDDPALTGRDEDIDDTLPEERREPLTQAIRAVDADILCLQEIESESALRWYMTEHLTGLGYDHVASIDAGDERGIEQAVLSRFPITRVQNWLRRSLGGTHPDNWGDAENWNAGEPILFHRSPLMVEVEIPARDDAAPPYRLTLLVVHQKSGGAPGAYWREAESRGLVELLPQIRADDPSRNIAILGDFNARTDQQSVRTYLEAGFTDIFAGRRGSEVTTHASGRRIDLILVNDALRPELVEASPFVLGTIQRPAGMSWRDPAPPGYASDHLPVAVDLIPIDR